jgi:polar amino acid transport system substrate-binding protein
MIHKSWLVVICTLALSICLAVAARAGELKVAIGLSLPPYVISESNSGFELDLVREALAKAGYAIKPVYMDFGQVPDALARAGWTRP